MRAKARSLRGCKATVVEAAIGRVMKALALLVVKDGEGATKVVHLTVKGAATAALAERIARRIAASPLVKTAFFGCDPNWGRIIAAAGDAGVPLDPDKVEIAIQNEVLARRGVEVPFSEEKMKKLMGGREIEARRQPAQRQGRIRFVHLRPDLRLHQDKRLLPLVARPLAHRLVRRCGKGCGYVE